MSNIWTVVNRLTNEIVYAYTSDSPVEWDDMPFSSFNHIRPEEKLLPLVLKRITKLEFVGLLGSDFYTLLSNSTVPEIAAFIKMIDWATPEVDFTSIDLQDPRTISGLQYLESAGLLAAGRAEEILNGKGV